MVGFNVEEPIWVKVDPAHAPILAETSDITISGISDSMITIRFSSLTCMPLRRSIYIEWRRSSNPPMVETTMLTMATAIVTAMPP